jgi:hypothetical protein
MDARHGIRADVPPPDQYGAPSTEAVAFVRFCYARRRVGWPELYDEMCAVASRGAFRGWGHAELAAHGICFTLFDMPGLAAIAAVVSREERERSRGRSSAGADGADGRLAATLAPQPTDL